MKRKVSIGLIGCGNISEACFQGCNGEFTTHVVEVMGAFEKASASGRYVRLASAPARPPILPPQLAPNVLDA